MKSAPSVRMKFTIAPPRPSVARRSEFTSSVAATLSASPAANIVLPGPRIPFSTSLSARCFHTTMLFPSLVIALSTLLRVLFTACETATVSGTEPPSGPS